MSLIRRRWFALGLALAACLLLLGRWVMVRDDAAIVPQRAHARLTPDQPVVSAPSLPPSEPSPSTEPTDQSALSFGTLRGRVIDAFTREPVREFALAFQGAQPTKVGDEAPGAQTFRTGDGRFVWEYATPGQWTLTASAPGYQRFVLSDLVITRGATTPEIVLPLRKGYTLRGRVYDQASGAGVASASIGFREAHVGPFEGNWRMRVRVQTDKAGAFVLDGLPPGRITVSAHSSKHAGRELDVVIDEATAPLEIGLSAGGSIAGRLTAADGVTPVAGAAGLFHLEEGFGGSSRTDESGEFSFQHLAAGAYRVTGQVGGATAEKTIVLGSNQHIDGVLLALGGAGRSIRGLVTGLRPEHLKRVSISVSRDGGGGGPTMGVAVDDRGAYVLHGVQPGRVHVVADVNNLRQLSTTVEVTADADVTANLNFPSGARLSGRVTRGGKPLAQAWVYPQALVQRALFIYGARTSTTGEYVIEDVPIGEYRVRADNYPSQRVRVSGDTVFDIDVPSVHLSGRVLEENAKAPVVGAEVNLWPAQPGSSSIRRYASSDHFGRFALIGLEPGDFLMTAYKPGYAMFRERISYSSPVSNMTIHLRRSRGVEISARDARTGKPLRGLYAYELIDEDYGYRLPLGLDENGVGYLPDALAGSTLSLSAEGYAPVVIREWSGERLDLQLASQPAR